VEAAEDGTRVEGPLGDLVTAVLFHSGSPLWALCHVGARGSSDCAACTSYQ
jgi:hypothetical protein